MQVAVACLGWSEPVRVGRVNEGKTPNTPPRLSQTLWMN